MLDDPAVALALAESHLGGLPADVTSALFEGARRQHARAASIVREIGEPGPYLELLVGGFLRIFVRAPDGRTLTVRYLRRGNVSGAVSLFTPDYALAATVQAHGDRLVAAVSQQALADAVGSVREVVVRVLHDLRAEGVIRTGRDGIEVIVPAALVDDQFPTRRSSARPPRA